jgi:prepilin-type N-terminal cleavage/methylation domain-containing protein
MRRKGFTLVELIVVICIIAIIASVTVGLVNIFFRGQGVRQGTMVVQQALAQAKQLAADKRTMYFVVFLNKSDGGEIQIYADTGTPTTAPNRQYDPGTDTQVQVRPYLLPKNVNFNGQYTPFFIGVGPSGYCEFSGTAVGSSASSGSGSFTEVQASTFEASLAANQCNGDIVLSQANKMYHMCLDVDRASGKIRRSHFLVQQQ